MIGLDVTRKIVLTPNLIEYMKRLHPFLGGKIEAITRFYLDFHWEQEGIIGLNVNGQLTIACLPDHSSSVTAPIQQWKLEESATDRLWWMPMNSGRSRTTATF